MDGRPLFLPRLLRASASRVGHSRFWTSLGQKNHRGYRLAKKSTGRVFMDKIRHPHQAAGSGRRTFLRLSAPGLLLPLGAMAPASWRTGPSSLPNATAPPPICRVAADITAVAPGSVPRELKIT